MSFNIVDAYSPYGIRGYCVNAQSYLTHLIAGDNTWIPFNGISVADATQTKAVYFPDKEYLAGLKYAYNADATNAWEKHTLILRWGAPNTTGPIMLLYVPSEMSAAASKLKSDSIDMNILGGLYGRIVKLNIGYYNGTLNPTIILQQPLVINHTPVILLSVTCALLFVGCCVLFFTGKRAKCNNNNNNNNSSNIQASTTSSP